MIAAYSSAVPVRRLLDAIFGTSPATWICAKRPSAVKIRMPLGVSPNGNDFLPSGDHEIPGADDLVLEALGRLRGGGARRQGKREHGGGDGPQLHDILPRARVSAHAIPEHCAINA
jgi:hypothetical protein